MDIEILLEASGDSLNYVRDRQVLTGGLQVHVKLTG